MSAWQTFCFYASWFALFAVVIAALVACQTAYRRPYIESDDEKIKQALGYLALWLDGLGVFALASTGESFHHPVPKTVTVTVPFSVR